MKIESLQEHPEKLEKFIQYFSQVRHNEEIYRNCMENAVNLEGNLPQWFILLDDNGKAIGGAGIVPNDFISRMDLYPWLCALFVGHEYRGKSCGGVLIRHALAKAREYGYPYLYLCTEHVGYYEKYGFEFIGEGVHPWGETSRIYRASTAVHPEISPGREGIPSRTGC